MKSKNPFLIFRLSAIKLLVLMCGVMLISSCSDDDDDNDRRNEPESIVSTAQGNNNLSSLVSALTKFPDLVSTLNGSGTYTVFAPTNDAFAAFLDAIGQEDIDDIPEDVLRKVLEYHVVSSGAVRSNQLSNGNVTTVANEPIAVTTAGGIALNGSAGVVAPDVEASNGVVHIIDEVLVPPSIAPVVGTIVAPAYFNKNFSTLVAAVVQADLLETLLRDDIQITLFAPTNDAFTAAGITSLPPDTQEGNQTLTSILAYHVIAGEEAIMAADIADGSSSAMTFGEQNIYLSKSSNGVFINGNSQVTAADIDASNGVVHVINRTLVPPTQTIAEIAAADENFSILVEALSRVPALLDAADSPGNLTVFAPTNEAFAALLAELGIDGLDDLDDATLAAVLQHHIVGMRVFSSDLPASDLTVTTLNQNFVINASTAMITDAAGRSANLDADMLNIHATNGVIHVVDKVLLPEL